MWYRASACAATVANRAHCRRIQEGKNERGSRGGNHLKGWMLVVPNVRGGLVPNIFGSMGCDCGLLRSSISLTAVRDLVHEPPPRVSPPSIDNKLSRRRSAGTRPRSRRSVAGAGQARHHVEPLRAPRRRCLVDAAERRFNDTGAPERDGA